MIHSEIFKLILQIVNQINNLKNRILWYNTKIEIAIHYLYHVLQKCHFKQFISFLLLFNNKTKYNFIFIYMLIRTIFLVIFLVNTINVSG